MEFRLSLAFQKIRVYSFLSLVWWLSLLKLLFFFFNVIGIYEFCQFCQYQDQLSMQPKSISSSNILKLTSNDIYNRVMKYLYDMRLSLSLSLSRWFFVVIIFWTCSPWARRHNMKTVQPQYEKWTIAKCPFRCLRVIEFNSIAINIIHKSKFKTIYKSIYWKIHFKIHTLSHSASEVKKVFVFFPKLFTLSLKRPFCIRFSFQWKSKKKLTIVT